MKRKAVSLAGRGKNNRSDAADATPERLAHARRDGFTHRDAQGVRRIGDPFDALHARTLLDRTDPAQNALLWQAGERLRRHWQAGQMEGLRAFDFTRDSVDTSPGQALAPSEAAVRHRDTLRTAREHVGARLWPYLVGIVIDARPVAALGSLVTDTGHARTQEALALDRLREALHRLCELWRMRPAGDTRRLRAWHDANPYDDGALLQPTDA